MNGYGGLEALLAFMNQYQQQRGASGSSTGAPDTVSGGDLALNLPNQQGVYGAYGPSEEAPDTVSGGDLAQNQPPATDQGYRPMMYQPRPYNMPYYQSSFSQNYNPYARQSTFGYNMYNPYTPRQGALFGQNTAGGKGGTYQPYGGYGKGGYL